MPNNSPVDTTEKHYKAAIQGAIYAEESEISNDLLSLQHGNTYVKDTLLENEEAVLVPT